MTQHDINRRREKFAKLILVLLSPSLLIFITYSLFRDILSPTVPKKDDPILAGSVQDNRRSDEVNEWNGVHVLSA